MPTNEHIKIFATDLKTDERLEITDLYWFEENGVHDFSGEAHWGAYFKLEIFVDGKLVFDNSIIV